MSAATIHELLNSLEQTIHERFRMIDQLLLQKAPEPHISELMARIQALETKLNARQDAPELLPTSPMVGLEVFRKQTLPVTTALAVTTEAEVELYMDDASAIDDMDDADSCSPEIEIQKAEALKIEVPKVEVPKAQKVEVPKVEAPKPEAPKPEVPKVEAPKPEAPKPEVPKVEVPKPEAPKPEVPDDTEEALELEEFEYKGATYYRDSDNNVFTTDEDGELNDEPFGLWNPVKQRIVARQ
jgi:hypothetical protein